MEKAPPPKTPSELLDLIEKQTRPTKKRVISRILKAISFIAVLLSVLLIYRDNVLLKKLSTGQNNYPGVVSPSPAPSGYNPIITQDVSKLTHSQIRSCSTEECLFVKDETPEGFAKIRGYYFEYDADDWGIPTTCKGFIVTGGNETLIANFNDWIAKGNNINKKIDGKLVVNLSFRGVEENIQQIINSSSEAGQVELGVIRISPVGRGASTCESVIGILTAKSLSD